MTKERFCEVSGIDLDCWIFKGMDEKTATYGKAGDVCYFHNGVDTQWLFTMENGAVTHAYHKGLGTGDFWVEQKWA